MVAPVSANKNKRYAWIAQELSKGQSNASIVLGCMTVFPGLSEKTARQDLKEILQRLTEIECETLPETKQKYLETLWKSFRDASSLGQYSAAANFAKLLAQIEGVITEKVQVETKPTLAAPEADTVRERIALLLKNKRIRQDADAANIDLDEYLEDRDKKK